jgi:RNA polymerase sigma-B factor
VILGEIRRHFRDATWRVHVPRPARERAWEVSRAEKELKTASGSVKPEAIANYLGIAPGDVADARRALEAYSPRSLDSSYVAPDGDTLPLREAIAADDSVDERAELSVGIRRALLSLKPRDQKVLLLRLACGLSQSEIAHRVGLSQMQVSRILRNAGARLTISCGLVVGA